MKTTIVGLFSNCEQALSAANILKNTGFKIIKLSCKDFSAKRKNHFQRYLDSLINIIGFERKMLIENYSENLVAGISTNNITKIENATAILKNAGAIEVFSFENMSKSETKSREFIRKLIGLHAKSEIPRIPTIKHHHSNEGISMLT